jgi:hypothetical protein
MLVYKWGIGPLPLEARQIIDREVRAAHRYRNRLVEIERSRRAAYRDLRNSLSPELAHLHAAYAAADRAVVEGRRLLSGVPRAERARHPVAAEVRRLSAARSGAWKAYAEARDRTTADVFGAADQKYREAKQSVTAAVGFACAVARFARGADPGPIGPHVLAAITAAVRERALADPAVGEPWKAKTRSQMEHEALAKRARAECGCAVGTYLAVEAAAEKSFAECAGDPPFSRLECERVGLQVRGGGLSADDVVGAAVGQVRVEFPADMTARANGTRYAVVHLHLSGRGDQATWLHLPVVWHRDMAPEARVRWAYVVARRVGLVWHYELQLTCDSVDRARAQSAGARGTIALNLGWRALKNGDLRVATPWSGSASRAEDRLVLPRSFREGSDLADRLLSYADEHFLAVRDALAGWFKGGERSLFSPEQVAAWSLDTVHAWRSHGRLARVALDLRRDWLEARGVDVPALWKAWRLERSPKLDLFGPLDEIKAWLAGRGVVSADQVLAVYLDWWRAKDRHLVNWARNNDLRLRRSRRDRYRCYARDLAARYERVVIEQWNKSETAETPDPEADTRTEQEVRGNSNRVLACVSELVDALEAAFGEANVHRAPSERITVEHHGCGGESSDPLPQIPVTCFACGQVYDQDLNAAKHLYDRHSGEPSGGVNVGGGARGAKKSRRVEGFGRAAE